MAGVSREVQYAIGAVLALAALALVFSGTGSAPTASGPAADNSPTASAVAKGPRFDPAKIDAMKKQLLAGRYVSDLVYQDGGPVEWQIGTRVAGSGVGYAETVCMDLAEKQLVDQDTDVRVVDLNNPAASHGDFRSASIGHVRCHDGADLGV